MKIIVLESKHCDYYFRANNVREMEESSRKIMEMHLGYYEDKLLEKVKDYLKTPIESGIVDGKKGEYSKAWNFIQSRSFDGYEYESVSLEEVE